MLTQEFKSRVKVICGIVGGFLLISGVKEVLPEFSAAGYLLVGFILLMIGVSK